MSSDAYLHQYLFVQLLGYLKLPPTLQEQLLKTHRLPLNLVDRKMQRCDVNHLPGAVNTDKPHHRQDQQIDANLHRSLSRLLPSQGPVHFAPLNYLGRLIRRHSLRHRQVVRLE